MTMLVSLAELAENNVRQDMDPAKMSQLVASIRARGVLQPILVRQLPKGAPHRWEIVDGHRRRAAALRAGLRCIPALHVGDSAAPDPGEHVRLLRQGALNLAREDFSPLDQGRLFEALISAGVKLEAILQEYGLSKTYVNDRRRLAKMPPKVLDLVRAGKVTITHAQALVGLPEERQVELATLAARERLSPRDMREEVGRGGAYHALPPAKQLVGVFAACASCDKVIDGCRRKKWDSDCPYNDSGFGPHLADCQQRGGNCEAVTLCPDRKCLLAKVATMVKAYREKHPEAKEWKQEAFCKERGYLEGAGAYASSSKWCRACKLAGRKLAPAWGGISVRSSCCEYQCPGREGKDPAKKQEQLSREREAGARANSPEAKAAAARREAARQALLTDLKTQVGAAAIAALKRPASGEDRKKLAKYLRPDTFHFNPGTKAFLDHVGDMARLKGDDFVRAGAILARLQGPPSWCIGPKELGNLIRELGGKVKKPQAKAAGPAKAKP